MTQRDYIQFARILGDAFSAASEFGGEPCRTMVYDSVYTPIVGYLTRDNPRFDQTRFAFAVAKREHNEV